MIEEKICVLNFNNLLYIYMQVIKKILFFDTETTWFVSDKSKYWLPSENEPNIVQLAWTIGEYIFMENEQWLHYLWSSNEKSFDILFKSIKPIPQKLTEIHWISNEMVANKPLAFESEEFLEFLKRTKEVDYIVWHNINYDLDMMLLETRRMFSSHDHEIWFMQCKEKSLDTMQVSTDLCKLPNARWWYKWPKLNELYRFLFSEDFDNAHNALADIIATQKCFFELVKQKVLSFN